MKKFLSAISLGIVALLLSPAVAAATDAKGVAKNVSDTLDSIAGSGYKGVVAIIALTLLGTRQFIAVAIFLVFCLVVGLVVFMTPQFIDLIKNTWTGLGL
jgi:CHASE2 domain-containing sensor protein